MTMNYVLFSLLIVVSIPVACLWVLLIKNIITTIRVARSIGGSRNVTPRTFELIWCEEYGRYMTLEEYQEINPPEVKIEITPKKNTIKHNFTEVK